MMEAGGMRREGGQQDDKVPVVAALGKEAALNF